MKGCYVWAYGHRRPQGMAARTSASTVGTDRVVLNPFPIEVNNSAARGKVAAHPAGAQIPRSNWENLRGGGRLCSPSRTTALAPHSGTGHRASRGALVRSSP